MVFIGKCIPSDMKKSVALPGVVSVLFILLVRGVLLLLVAMELYICRIVKIDGAAARRGS